MKKMRIIISIMVVTLLIIPLILLKFIQPYEFMGVIVLLFFIINPINAVIVNLMAGKDIKKFWWVPIAFSILFLFSYWIILKEIILDLTIYSLIYLILGIICMLISWFVAKKIKK